MLNGAKTTKLDKDVLVYTLLGYFKLPKTGQDEPGCIWSSLCLAYEYSDLIDKWGWSLIGWSCAMLSGYLETTLTNLKEPHKSNHDQTFPNTNVLVLFTPG